MFKTKDRKEWRLGFREKLEREREIWDELVSIPKTPINGGVYRLDRNEETKPTLVSEVDRVARNN